MAKRRTANPAKAAPPAPGKAPRDTDTPRTDFDIDELKNVLADYVCDRTKLTWLQAYVGMSLLKRVRGGPPPNAPDTDEKPQKISLRWERPKGA